MKASRIFLIPTLVAALFAFASLVTASVFQRTTHSALRHDLQFRQACIVTVTK